MDAREPGQRMVVTGRVFDSTGKRVLPKVWIGVYQADARGFYGATTPASPVARLHGWLRTDSLGRYQVRTIWDKQKERWTLQVRCNYGYCDRGE